MEMPTDNREKILAKSRELRKDEGLDFAEKRGNKLGIILYAIVSGILIFFCIPNHMIVVKAIAALSSSWCIGGTLSYYRFTKKKIYLLCFFLSIFTTIIHIVLVILGTMS